MKRKNNFTKWAFNLHGWLGLMAGLFFLFYGITGSMLMFRGELDRYFNPEIHHIIPEGKMLGADEIYRNLVRSHPNLKKIVLHDFPVDAYDSYEFMVYRNQQETTENYLYYVCVNPYSGKILKEGSYAGLQPSFFRWLYSLHYSLQLGMPGKLFSAIIGLIMLLSLITGIIVYRKHFWDALRFKAGLNFKNSRTAISSLHRIIGVWAMLFTALLFFTGFWMNREHFSPETWKINPPVQNTLVKVDIDSLVAASRKLVKGFEPIAVNIPTTPGIPVQVRGHMPSSGNLLYRGKASGFTFDQNTGKLLNTSAIEKQPFAARFDAWMYQLHIGAFGGGVLKSFYVLLGLLPGFLSVTGALLWFKRKRKAIS
ncbi:PepSY-associated TM helix domain-containing protein [Pedobacter miscanthi]|uniref:PepSY-associated TM helix domain-containing protein n=1 Tax=Pedobacter miscanthi TaxID=2259170 RepID=UPI0029312667|nr:PepSY-associated TM helix domain-containing protein [Pedobacter miscanthi]